jgi:uncharacterized phage protein (TIGR02216 family)
MAFGLGVLRLSPGDFWGMSLPEFEAAVRGFRGEAGRGEPLRRGVLRSLMQRFPDHQQRSQRSGSDDR